MPHRLMNAPAIYEGAVYATDTMGGVRAVDMNTGERMAPGKRGGGGGKAFTKRKGTTSPRSPSSARSHPFLGEGSQTKIDYRRKLVA